MKIAFVIGPALSGKTTYIINHYPHATVVNFSYFAKFAYAAQSNDEIEEIVNNAQYYCRRELQERLKSGDPDEVYVLEHSMLKKAEREFYISMIRDATDTPIDAFVMAPREDILRQMLKNEKPLLSLYAYEKEQMEPPTLEEGFATITYIDNPIE